MKYVTSAQAAKIIGKKVRWIQALVKRGDIAGVTKFGHAYMIPEESLAAVKNLHCGRPITKPNRNLKPRSRDRVSKSDRQRQGSRYG